MSPQQQAAPDGPDHHLGADGPDLGDPGPGHGPSGAGLSGDGRSDAGPGVATRPLNRPARWAFAAVELAVVIGLVAVAVWAWGKSSVPYRLPDYENPAIPDVVNRQSGPWTAAAVGAALLAGVFLLDALRQTILAARAGRNTTAAPDPHVDATPPDRDTPAYGANPSPPDRDTPAYRGDPVPPDRDVPAYGAKREGTAVPPALAPSDRDVPPYREGAAPPDRDTPAYGADHVGPDRVTPAYGADREGTAPPDLVPPDRDTSAYRADREGTDERG